MADADRRSPRPFLVWAAPPSVGLGAVATLRLPGSDGVQVSYPAVGASDVERVVVGLAEAREALAAVPIRRLIRVLGSVGDRFLDEGDPLRHEALALLPDTAGLSPAMSRRVLDGMAEDWTAERLERLVRTELGDPAVLDGFVDAPGTLGAGSARSRRTMVVGGSLTTQIVAGSVPGVGATALVRSLLCKSPTLLKPGRGDVVLPVLFAKALAADAPEVASALAVVYWPGGDEAVERAALARAEVVTVYGSDETVRSVRKLAPVTSRVVAYRHRISVGVVGRDALAPDRIEESARAVAEAVALFDQRGCVSPQLVFVEEGGATTPGDFAEAVAGALAAWERDVPGGRLEAEEASALQQLRGTAEVLEGAGTGRVWHGGATAGWTVVFGDEVGVDPYCVGRVARLRAVRDADEVPRALAGLGPHLQSLAVAGLAPERAERLAERCGRAGVTRITTFERLAFPPPWWLHDGRGPLLELLRWVEAEAE